jgi:DNA-binding transcriptional regulator PaaX
MNLICEILKTIWNTSHTYKGVQVNLLGIPTMRGKSENTIKVTLSQMRKNGLIRNEGELWEITPIGKNYFQKKFDSLKQFNHTFKKDAPKNLIVMFDIPETQKAEREWFRWHLKKFGYEMIQKSVWVGPSPLPPQFLQYVDKIKLKKTLKTFKLAKGYHVQNV